MAGDYRVAPDEWECQVFIAVAETHGATAAAEHLKALRGGTYNRQSVEKVLAKLNDWAGEPLLERYPDRRLYPTVRGQRFLESARNVVTQYRAMRDGGTDPDLPTLACLPHHTNFVGTAEDLLFEEAPERTDKVRVEYLSQNQRGEAEFRRDAVARLRSNSYQLIIGPRVDDAMLESTTLYHAQLEAMVGTGYPNNEISLGDLVRKHRMLVPPRDMLSRRMLEQAILAWGIDDPGSHVRVAAETYETATSILRIRSEDHRRGASDSRVVVVPSDVALVYKRGREFGGLHAERFKWVPIYHREGRTEHLLRMEVCVTVRRRSPPDVRRVVSALARAVATLADPVSGVGLCGERFRGRRPSRLPSQVTREGQASRMVP